MPARVAIVGSAQTDLKPAWSDRQHVDLVGDVVRSALAATGLRIEEIDFVVDSGSDILDGRSISNCGFLGAAGAHQKEEARIEEDGLWGAVYGVTKIASGSAELALVVAYAKPSEGSVEAFYATQCDPFVQRPVGFGQRPALGLQAQRYLLDHGLDREVLETVAAKAWARAVESGTVGESDRPDAGGVDDVVAAPLRRGELSRHVDGAVAVVLAAEHLVDRFAATPVWVTGMGAAMDQYSFPLRDAALPACRAAGSRAMSRAGIDRVEDLALVESSAPSAAAELLVYEALGLAPPGRGIDALADGAPVDVNPSGGALPADPVMATGLVRLREAATRLPDAPGPRRAALVHATGGVAMQNHCVVTLEVEG